MAAAFFQAQQWNISEDEAKSIARAIIEVQEQYSVSLDPKTQAWINLAFILAAAYGPRIMVTYQQAKKPKPKPDAEKQPEKPQPKPDPQPGRKNEPTTPSQAFGLDYAKG